MRFKDNGKFNDVYGKTYVGANLIQGQACYEGTPFFSQNPANPGDRVGVFPEAANDTLESACRAALQALEPWQKQLPSQAELFQANMALLLEAQQNSLASLLTRETGMVWAQSQALLTALRTALAQKSFTDPAANHERDLPAARALISPSFLPGALPLNDILAALLAGHSLVWKVWDQVPTFAYVFAQIMKQAGLPPGVLNLIHGSEAVESGLLRQIESGRLAPLACESVSENLAKVQSVSHESDLEQAVNTALQALTSPEQQRGSHNVVLEAKIAEAFKTRLLRRLQNVKLGDPNLDHKVQCGPLSDSLSLKMFLAHLNWGKSDGAQLLSGKGRLSRESKPENFIGDPDAGYFVWPAIWDQLKPGMKLAINPVYGPSLRLFTVADQSAAVALGVELGLSKPS